MTYNICLLKEDVTSLDAAIDGGKELSRYRLQAAGINVKGTLFVGEQKRSTPSWVAMLNEYLQQPLPRLYSANVSAVLLIEHEGRIFALCFGHGKSLLAGSSWVRDFGLKVTLNRVRPDKLRSLDSKTYEDMVVSTRKQTSRGSRVTDFQLDVARDLVRGVTGDATDTDHFTRLTGADSLSVASPIPFHELGDLLDELLVAYDDDKYKDDFGFIDNIKEVDQKIREDLDNLLVVAFRAGNVSQMHLAPSDIVEWENVAGFNFTGGIKRITYPELDLSSYLEVLGDKKREISIDTLKRHKVRTRKEDSEEFEDQWSIHECLVWETKLGDDKYVLFDGRWFLVEKEYASRVQNYVRSIDSVAITLPSVPQGHSEGRYNQSVAAGNPTQFALLDCETVRATNAGSMIEFCDLMSLSGHFIHVKKRSSSATLSHLFSQGSVACDTFLQDVGVREAVKLKLTTLGKASHAALIPRDRPVPANYQVVYAVLAKDARPWPPELPFFSAVNLMHHASRIQNLGFEVSIQHVKQT